MPLQLDPFQQIVNVHWEEAVVGFLFIYSDAVHTSTDGREWNRIADGFAANGVAYGRNVWVAATDDGMRISEDNGETWQSIGGPSCKQIVFAGPGPEEEEEEEESTAGDSGAFYALDTANSEGEADIYSSTDGRTWNLVLSLPELNFDEPGIAGYSPENLQTQGSTVVLTASEWTQVPTDEVQAGSYTRAAKYTGSDGSIGGPDVYGPEGRAHYDDQANNSGAGAAADASTGATYIAYLESHSGSGEGTSAIVVNDAPVATSSVSGTPPSGSDVNGGDYMTAADGDVWFFGNEIFFPDFTMEFFAMSLAGERQQLLPPVSVTEITDQYFGNSCALPQSETRADTAFCTVVSLNEDGGLFAKVGGGAWTNIFESSRGAVGVGKIATSPSDEE